MLRDKEPKRGSFDYLLDGNSIHEDPPIGRIVVPPNGGHPRGITINIEITERRRTAAQERRSARFASRILVLIVLLVLIALAAHGETRWQENRVGTSTYWYNPGTGERGQEWNMPDGSVRSTWQGPDGRTKDCVVQQFGNALSMRCN